MSAIPYLRIQDDLCPSQRGGTTAEVPKALTEWLVAARDSSSSTKYPGLARIITQRQPRDGERERRLRPMSTVGCGPPV